MFYCWSRERSISSQPQAHTTVHASIFPPTRDHVQSVHDSSGSHVGQGGALAPEPGQGCCCPGSRATRAHSNRLMVALLALLLSRVLLGYYATLNVKVPPPQFKATPKHDPSAAPHVLDSVPSVCFAYRLSLQLLPHSSRVLQCDGTVNKIIFDLVHPSFLFQVYLEKKIIFSFRLHDLRIPACRY